jgi:tRNA threonylcarbamoyladenosine biosynthesis protein TsaB
VAVSAGPGSYTGLRIGASTAKGYGAALGLPLVAVPTLDALALGALAAVAEGEELLVALPSRRGEVYAARYTRDGDDLVVMEPATPLAVEDVPGWAWTRNLLVLAGPGADRLAPFFPHAPRLPETAVAVGAAPVARLGADRLAAGDTADLDTWEPDYLKPFVPGGTGEARGQRSEV